ncbi:hypothetical protein MSG28_009092 [Choristoneura fumiferana]|uniref:Uncharacterized protein n=1 Tax=Choristoneura fumiferana TaxID=7141 RepID=A0ACC0KW03_CHOFU|nr:hypothetical protein MSG28_009092 [Choristoneura fumiferana]
MGVGLVPLEFTECLADSPHFRENLLRHEKELDRTSQQVKRLIKELGRAHEQIIAPLERFRKEHIGAVKEGKKKFDKKTAKFCQSQERTLSLSTKKQENVFQEADAAMDMAERDFCQASLEYVFQLQAVREREKFELVETLLGFVFSWWTFHHTAHDVHHDAEPLMRDLQLRIQRTRTNFEETSKQTESLMKKMMEVRQMNKEVEAEEGGEGGDGAPQGGRAGGVRHGVEQTLLLTAPAESVCLCGARRAADSERRFCWDALPADRDRAALTLQALSERDRAAWLRVISHQSGGLAAAGGALRGAAGEAAGALDDAGFAFVRRIIAVLEERGLEEQGLYRVAGVASKVARLVACAADARLPATLHDPLEWESKTLTSALKAAWRRWRRWWRSCRRATWPCCAWCWRTCDGWPRAPTAT